MFHLLDNILIFGIFVFAAVMAIRMLTANTPQEKPPPEESGDPVLREAETQKKED